jgi:hypothetical protein
MTIRILHCGKSIENYTLCIQHKVAGFTRRGALTGELIYLAVKVGKNSLCGARGILSDNTDEKPWEDSENYVNCFRLEQMEFCQPFDIKILKSIGGNYWALKFVQGAKPINNEEAEQILNQEFANNISEVFTEFTPTTKIDLDEDTPDEETIEVTEQNIEEILNEVPETEIKIMGTFQTIKFLNETDKIRGLESLVNANFYSLFPEYSENKSVLISDNRKFLSKGITNQDQNYISGIQSIPDAILITFNPKSKCCLQINLIEYECYGEKKTRSLDKNNYLNGHIIPQLMKFASTFSVVTDKQIRELTAKAWTDKIIDYIYKNNKIENKFSAWIKELLPELNEQRIGLKISEILLEAFKTNLQVQLIIDELSSEQKSTISNVIKAFKLENGNNIQFIGKVVRLEQKIQLIDGTAEFALSVQ